MPQYDTYEVFIQNISDKIHQRTGWKLSKSEDIAKNIVKHVQKSPGGGFLWKNKFTYGMYDTSHYTTLKQFLKALSSASIPTGVFSDWENRQEFRSLIAKFQTRTSIEALNAFTEKYSKTDIKSRKEKFIEFFKPIKNDIITLNARDIENKRKLMIQNKISYAELKEKLTSYLPTKVIIKDLLILGIANASKVFTPSEATIGPLSLGGMGIDSPTAITSIEVAHSNQIVKFRAVGSIYLAHQVGGNDSVHIIGMLRGPMRFFYLTALWILTLLSQGYFEVVDWDSDLVNIVSNSLAFREAAGDFLQVQKVENIITQKPTYRKHITYPVVLEHEIITNAYIESFSFEEKIAEGRDLITYDLLMRTYVEPKEFLSDAKRSIMAIGKTETMTEQILNYGLNFTYRLMKQGKESMLNIDSNDWKVKNYYDLDAADVATTMTLALAGVIWG